MSTKNQLTEAELEAVVGGATVQEAVKLALTVGVAVAGAAGGALGTLAGAAGAIASAQEQGYGDAI